ncbi:MAG: biotin/lipoyl-binding protein, partial [Cyanobacteria bacterium P01_A01_bin.105]
MPPRLSLSRCASALGVLTGLLICTTGCRIPSSNAQPRGRPGTPDPDQPVAVQTLRTQASAPVSGLTYTGTTRPIQQVAIKAQVAGRITVLPVDIGDRVIAGQVLAQLDGDLQTATVNQEQAELSARRAEAAQTNVAIIDAQAAVVQAEAALTQAQNDANRLRRLANQGALSEQTAEAAALDLISAQQVLNSAQAQVTARQQTAASAKERINAQQAVVDQSQVRLAYAA